MTFSECTAIAKVFSLYELTRAQLLATSDKDLRANAAAIARLEQSKPNASTADLDKVAAILFPGTIYDHPAFSRLIGRSAAKPPAQGATPTNPPPDPSVTPAPRMAAAPAIIPTGAPLPPASSPAAPNSMSGHPAVPPQPPSLTANAPLSATELAALARLLPQCNPKRFLTKHTPARWREVLARLVASPP